MASDATSTDAKFEGRVAIITGGGSGIGRAAALALSGGGARVAIFDLSDENGRKVADEIIAGGGEAIFAHCDVAEESDVAAAVSATAEAFGRVDVLLNSAGLPRSLGRDVVDEPIDEVTEEEWDRVLNSHLKGCFLCIKHAVRQMKRNGGGAIVNIASIAGLVGMPYVHAYGAAKAGIMGLTRELAIELADFNIRVNAIAPGAIDTPMNRRGGGQLPEQFLEGVRASYPLKRHGEPEDIANGILYLASDGARFVTGTVLVIDGGFTAR